MWLSDAWAVDNLRSMGAALDDLIDLLQLEQLEVNLFRGLSPDEDRQRVFGGQVAGQALIAAGRKQSSCMAIELPRSP